MTNPHFVVLHDRQHGDTSRLFANMRRDNGLELPFSEQSFTDLRGFENDHNALLGEAGIEADKLILQEDLLRPFTTDAVRLIRYWLFHGADGGTIGVFDEGYEYREIPLSGLAITLTREETEL